MTIQNAKLKKVKRFQYKLNILMKNVDFLVLFLENLYIFLKMQFFMLSSNPFHSFYASSYTVNYSLSFYFVQIMTQNKK